MTSSHIKVTEGSLRSGPGVIKKVPEGLFEVIPSHLKVTPRSPRSDSESLKITRGSAQSREKHVGCGENVSVAEDTILSQPLSSRRESRSDGTPEYGEGPYMRGCFDSEEIRIR